ncbi:MAG: TonB-dependent receptor [Bacteroidota bacterium]
MKRTVLLILIILLNSSLLSLSAQTKGNGSVSGRIIDKQSKSPVEYSNIALYDTVKKAMVTGVVSDSSGNFKLANLPLGHYYLEYSFIGYEKRRSKTFSLTKTTPKRDLGVLYLSSSAINMEEVNITAEKSMMITKIDRKVFNIQKEISAQTGTVTDMLQTIPSVSVDMDGNISIRGSGNVTILINGRPSIMAGVANLDQMPASMVERVEVITNPSAKYKPDGTGGILNIILKKEQKAGFNTIVGANAGNHDRYNANIQLNSNTGSVNLFGSYGFRQDSRVRSGYLNSEAIDSISHQSVFLTQTSRGTSRSYSHLGRLGMDWSIDTKNITGLSGTFNYRDNIRNEVTDNLYQDTELKPTSDFIREMNGKESETSLGINAFFEHTFDKASEHHLRADFEYQKDRETEDDLFTISYTLPDSISNYETVGVNSQQQINLSLEYSRPLWKDASLETGYQGNANISDETMQVYLPDKVEGMEDPAQANIFSSSQTVHALFGTVHSTWGKFGLMVGLRAEETLLDLQFKTTNSETRSNYFAVYPTIHTSLASGENEWQLNYSRRINRPDAGEMNPVKNPRSDPKNYWVGNPELKPEDIHSIEFGYAVKTKSLTLVPTLFYRYKTNGFTMVTETRGDTLITKMENLATDQSAGVDLSGTLKIGKIVSLNFGASGFYSQIDASNIGYSNKKSTFSWNSKMNASFYITKTTLFQLNTQYRSKVLTAQGMREPSWGMNLGFRQDFWKKKISLLITVSDLFNTQIWKTSVSTTQLIQESMRRRDGRVFYAGFIFNFGTSQKKTKEPKLEFDNGGEN